MLQHSPSHEQRGTSECPKTTAVEERTYLLLPVYWCWYLKLTYRCVVLGPEFAAKWKGECEDKRTAGPGVCSCTCTRLCDRQHHPQCRAGWSHDGRRGHGICSFFLPWGKKQAIAHTHAYSLSWLLCSTIVSLQLWVPEEILLCAAARSDLTVQGAGRRELVKKKDKSLKMSSWHYIFTVNLHLAKMETTDATDAYYTHRMTAWTVKRGTYCTTKSSQQSSQMPYLHLSERCGTGHCWLLLL